MRLTFNCVGIEVKLEIRGAEPQIFGFYDQYPSGGGKPDLVVELNRRSDWPGISGSFGPHFQVSSPAHDTLAFKRADVEGSYQWQKDGSLQGSFQSSLGSSGLEAVVRIGLSLLLPTHDALLLHSSCVSYNGRGLVFSGISGAGKSTISDILSELPAVTKIADELLIIQKSAEGWRVHVPPFAGTQGLPFGTSVRLDAMHLLHQAPEHERVRMQASSALPEFCRHVLSFGRSAKSVAEILELIANLVESIPCYDLYFAKNTAVCDVLGITCAREAV